MDKKKLLYGVLGVVLIFGIGISYYLTAQPSNSMPGQPSQMPSPSPMMNNGTSNTSQTTNTMQTTQPDSSGSSATPEDITKSFYDWYMNYPKDVVATGAYKTSPYLSDSFKTTINDFAKNYDPKFDPIFCNVNKTKSYAIAKATGTPTKMIVQITDRNVDAPKPLYNVIIVQQKGILKIDDVICQ